MALPVRASCARDRWHHRRLATRPASPRGVAVRDRGRRRASRQFPRRPAALRLPPRVRRRRQTQQQFSSELGAQPTGGVFCGVPRHEIQTATGACPCQVAIPGEAVDPCQRQQCALADRRIGVTTSQASELVAVAVRDGLFQRRAVPVRDHPFVRRENRSTRSEELVAGPLRSTDVAVLPSGADLDDVVRMVIDQALQHAQSRIDRAAFQQLSRTGELEANVRWRAGFERQHPAVVGVVVEPLVLHRLPATERRFRALRRLGGGRRGRHDERDDPAEGRSEEHRNEPGSFTRSSRSAVSVVHVAAPGRERAASSSFLSAPGPVRR